MGRTSDARERLVKAATELISSRSYEAVGVAEICDQAGVKKGSFYHFFPSKQDLTLAVLDHQWEEAQIQFLDPIFSMPGTAQEKINTYFDRCLEWAEETKAKGEIFRGCPFGSLGMEMSPKEPAIRERILGVFDAYTDRFIQTLREEATAGRHPDIDPEKNGRAVFCFIQGVLLYTKAVQNDLWLKEQRRAALALAFQPARAYENGGNS